ncbi:MAG: hypothetical protein ACR2FS_15955, partial [Phormidesmis sp.]
MLAMNHLSDRLRTTFSTSYLATSCSALGLGIGAIASSAVIGVGMSGAIALPAQAQSANRNPEIEVGIVQRFGENETDKIVLAPLTGDQLKVDFTTNGQAQTLTASQLQINTVMQPLSEPVLQEWVVLSTHRSFESAEDSANRWQAAGIAAEIAQPDAWQVWAKRDDYSTPLLRRLLLKNLQAAGDTTAYIDSRVVTEVPKVAFTANGYRYVRDEFTV